MTDHEESYIDRVLRDAGLTPELAERQLRDVLDPDRPRVRMRRAADVRMERMDWAWTGRIPRSGLSMIAGREGTGKSTVAMRLIADLTRGTLHGAYEGDPQNVGLLSLEDDMATQVVPRLVAAGADLTRVSYGAFLQTPDGPERFLPHKTRHLQLLGEYLKDEGITVLYLDVFHDLLPPDVSILSPEAGSYTRPLNEWAQKLGVAVLAAWHVTKGGGRSVDKVQGNASATAGAVRSVLYLAERPDTETPTVVLAVTKSNGASLRAVAPLATEIVGADVTLDDGTTTSVSHALMLAPVALPDGCLTGRDYVDRLIEEAHAQFRAENGLGTTQGAQAWLHAYLLEHGQTRKARVLAHAEEVGHTDRTVERAAERLGVRYTKVGRESLWSLPEGDDD